MILTIYKFLKFIFRHIVPGSLRYPLARGIARCVCLFNARRRKVLVSNLTPLVGPAAACRLAPALLGNFAMTAVDFFCSRPGFTPHVEIDGWSHIVDAYQHSRRVMIVTAHLGNWEVGISHLVAHGYPVAALYATYTDDHTVQWIMNHRNPQVQWIPTTPGAADICVAALEQGRVLCIAADIPFGEHGRRVQLAGHPTRLPTGPWSIALRAKATVIPAFVLRRAPGRYQGMAQEAIPAASAGSLKSQIVKMQDVYRAHLEHFLKAYPEQWGNLQPFWEN